MRRCFPAVVLGLILGTAGPASAQGGSGVVIGANFANIEFTSSDVIEPDRRTGLVAGVFIRMPVAPSLSVQPEFLYSQKGAKFQEGNDEVTLELDYIDVPVLVRVTAGGPNGLALFGGPSMGFKIRARSKTDVGGNTESEDIGEDVETFDFGLILGAGVQGGSFFLDGRYQWGLSNFNKDETEPEVKNKVLSIVLGFRF